METAAVPTALAVPPPEKPPLTPPGAYDLFGSLSLEPRVASGVELPPVAVGPADQAAVLVAKEVVAVETQVALVAPSSPDNFELFPLAPVGDSLDKPKLIPSASDSYELFPSLSSSSSFSSGNDSVMDAMSAGGSSREMNGASAGAASSLHGVSSSSTVSLSAASSSSFRDLTVVSSGGGGSSRELVVAPPPVVPPPVPPSYKMSGNAVDIVAVRNTDDQFLTTSWHVCFSWSRFRSNATTGVGDMVRILVNGKELPTKMELLERGRCAFITGGVSPPPSDLLFVDLREDEPNHVRYEHWQKATNTVRYVDARLHVWGANESAVVVDLDGTLTISDVEGHIRTLRLGQYDFLHPGACDFFTKLHELDLRIVYLTARPLDWATASRQHLDNATQQAHALPPGVLITSSNGLTGALFTEVVNKTPHIFKAQVLNELQLTLIHAGRVTEHPVFVAGFGNRPTDIVAYEQVGVDACMIFLLDPYSNLRAASDPRVYESYADPNALLWLLPRLKHRVPIEKVERIDAYTVRELVFAEEREQLLMAERKARELQEEEYARARQASTTSASSSSRSLYGYLG